MKIINDFQTKIFIENKKGRTIFSLWVICLLVIMSPALPSCSKKARVLTDQELYNQAMDYLGKDKFRKAEEVFGRLTEEYPESPLMAKTRLNRADCYFQLKEFDSARAEYERFLNLHPLHSKADMARFRIGQTFFKQILGPDRDQTYTIKALESFERFLKEYPQSQMTEEAKDSVSKCRLRLSEHDLYVARFYLKTGSYKAARGRLQKIWSLYPEVPWRDETLYLLSQTYMMEGMLDEARGVQAYLCREFPESPFTEKIKVSCKDIEPE
ncbi:outer membrane protein assembly factor BamD [bacterium]|nr:outer membrane protein assembly factor BamD [bacterium]